MPLVFKLCSNSLTYHLLAFFSLRIWKWITLTSNLIMTIRVQLFFIYHCSIVHLYLEVIEFCGHYMVII